MLSNDELVGDVSVVVLDKFLILVILLPSLALAKLVIRLFCKFASPVFETMFIAELLLTVIDLSGSCLSAAALKLFSLLDMSIVVLRALASSSNEVKVKRLFLGTETIAFLGVP